MAWSLGVLYTSLPDLARSTNCAMLVEASESYASVRVSKLASRCPSLVKKCSGSPRLSGSRESKQNSQTRTREKIVGGAAYLELQGSQSLPGHSPSPSSLSSPAWLPLENHGLRPSMAWPTRGLWSKGGKALSRGCSRGESAMILELFLLDP